MTQRINPASQKLLIILSEEYKANHAATIAEAMQIDGVDPSTHRLNLQTWEYEAVESP